MEYFLIRDCWEIVLSFMIGHKHYEGTIEKWKLYMLQMICEQNKDELVEMMRINKYNKLKENDLERISLDIYRNSRLLFNVISYATNIRALYLYNERIRVKELAYCLQKNTNISCISMNCSNIEHVFYLYNPLVNPKTKLKYLWLGHNHISDIILLGRALKKNEILTDLDLESNQIIDIDDFMCSITYNNTLERLMLGSNKISNVYCLSDYLRFNICLKALYLSNNPLWNINGIVEGIKYNVSLETLSLNNCNIHSISSLVDSLIHNNTLKNLELGDNYITDIFPFLKLFKHTRAMETIKLKNNRMSYEHKRRFFEQWYLDKQTQDSIYLNLLM